MLKRLGHAVASIFQRSIPLSTLRASAGVYSSTVSGITVNEVSALKFGAVFASIRVIAETRGSLPIKVYEVNKSGKRAEVTQHPVAHLLGIEPNPDMTPMVCNETCTAHVLGWGNSYEEIAWDANGQAAALIPRHPSLVTPYRDASGALMYRVTPETTGNVRNLDRSQMLHVPGLGGNGLVGWSVVRMAAESIGIGLGQDQMAAAFFGNKAKPGLLVKVPGKLEDTEFTRLKHEIDTQFQGQEAFKALLLEGGMEATSFSMPMDEAQFLESREFQGEEIACRWFRLPPHVVGYLRRATFSNVEAQDLYFEKHSMRPWLVRFEQEMNRKLFSRAEWGRFYVKHNVDALLRADIKTRYEAHKSAILAGWMNRNEVRELEDRDPVDGLDDYPLPEAIFGKAANDAKTGDAKPGDAQNGDGGTKKSGEQKSAGQPPGAAAPDKRLQALTEQLLAGLLQREVCAVERCAGKSDFRDEVTRFYERHLPLVAERLQPLACPPEPAIAAAVARRDALLGLEATQAVNETRTWTVGDLPRLLLGEV